MDKTAETQAKVLNYIKKWDMIDFVTVSAAQGIIHPDIAAHYLYLPNLLQEYTL